MQQFFSRGGFATSGEKTAFLHVTLLPARHAPSHKIYALCKNENKMASFN